MIIAVRLDADIHRGWHLALLERLSALDGVQATLSIAPGRRGPDYAAFMRIEGWLRRQPAGAALRPVPAESLARWLPTAPSPSADLTLDLSSEAGAAPGRCWRLLVDGSRGVTPILSAAFAGRAPVMEIREGEQVLAAARPGTDRGDAIQTAADDMFDRLVTLCVAAARGGRPTLPALPDEWSGARGQPISMGLAASRTARGLARGAAGALYRRLYRTPHWRVGWRKLQGPDLFDLRRHPDGGWRDLADDGERFYADPFPFFHDGRLTLFVEDFPHATGKGIISAVAFDDDGPVGAPEPVLELPEHLSYPFVFARDGEIWMIPENCQTRRVDLYRATAFPGGWVREATLIDDIVASDATLVEHGGLWWMFATVRDGGGFSDALHLWSAPDFRGPWTPHSCNPVLVDIASARPAGAMAARDAALFRPVQDCRRGYGKALGLARVTRLDAGGFEQQVETVIEAGGPLWPGRRIHSLNAAGGFEFIDGSAEARRRLPWEKPVADGILK